MTNFFLPVMLDILFWVFSGFLRVFEILPNTFPVTFKLE